MMKTALVRFRKSSACRIGKATWPMVCLFVLTACVSTALDPDNRGARPISDSLLKKMKIRQMKPSSAVLVRIFKLESELELWKRDRSGKFALLHTYSICRWSGQLGPKKREGDRQAPEGLYEVNASRLNPRSRYLPVL